MDFGPLQKGGEGIQWLDLWKAVNELYFLMYQAYHKKVQTTVNYLLLVKVNKTKN